jgi:acetyl-CoA carboxylase biotin carboxyl carrier protein
METKEIIELINRFEKGTIAELSLEKGDFKLSLKKAQAFAHWGTEHGMPAASSAGEGSSGAPSRTGAHASSWARLPEQAERPTDPPKADQERIVSPLVATFYRAPSPDAPPFVEPGKRVRKGDTLCVLEAMKVMNRFEAEYDCEIASILAENGKLVEYGQALFEVKRV